MRQLTNFDRLLDAKIEKFHSTIKTKPRILFILPDSDHFQEYLRQKIKDKEKRDRLKKAKMIIKIIAALVMTISFLLIALIMKRMLTSRNKNFELKKAKVEKAKRKKQIKKRNKKKRQSKLIADVL